MDGEAFFVLGVRVVNLHGEDAVVAVFVGNLYGAVALASGRIEFPGNFRELDIVRALRLGVDVSLKDADNDPLGRIGHRVICLGK